MIEKQAVRLLMASSALLLVSTIPAMAQERSRTWASLGFGVGAAQDGDALAIPGTLVHQRGAHYFALRGVVVADPFDSAGRSTGELAVLYGRSARRRYGHLALASGLAAVTVDPCRRPPLGRFLSDGATPGCTTIGIPFLAEAAVQPLPILGLGVQAFANVNTKGSFAGVGVFLQVGWMP